MASRDYSALGYRRIVILLVALVVVPTFLLLTVGALLLFLGEAQANLLFGILVISLSATAATGVVLVMVFVRREANLSVLQNDFVSKVSHELRTPLTSIRLFSETLAMRRGDVAAEDKCIEGLARESTRLQDLIDRLLDWGRMESGRREFRLERTDVVEVAKRARAAFTAVLERRPGELTVELPDEPMWVDADRDALVDAILNLLTNAHKYGGDPPQIRFRLYNGGDDALISVTDNGPGIEPREHERIFQKFYRVDDRLSREREGSGLGLSIVKHVVRAHRGRIELDSGPGQGSTFRIALAKKSAPDASTRSSKHE